MRSGRGKNMVNSVIVSACRTAIGSFQGTLTPFRSPDLGGIVIKEAVKRAGIKPGDVQEGIMGCVLPAGLGQSPARQAILAAGLPKEVGALTVNKVCSSGLVAVMQADRYVKNGECEIAVAGGMESMTNAPYLLPKGRLGYRMGDGKIVDSMVNDGLWDIYTNQHMGGCAELCAKEYKVSRAEQDEFAINSYKKAIAAQENGKFDAEITGVPIPQRKGDPVIFNKDEEPGKVKFEKVPGLKPVFAKDGTVTAANASSISDGAAALVVMSETKAKALGLKPLARIVSYAGFSQEPEWFTTAPINASKKAVERAGLDISKIDLVEANEAFSVQSIVVTRELGLDPAKVNVNGGAVAIGHPIGCSGARILTTLIYALRDKKGKYGLVTLCNGGGEATAMVVEVM